LGCGNAHGTIYMTPPRMFLDKHKEASRTASSRFFEVNLKRSSCYEYYTPIAHKVKVFLKLILIFPHLRGKISFDEIAQIAVQNSGRVSRLLIGAVILDHLVRMEHIGPDLVAPTRVDVVTF
jgi:hypothetical protein